MPTRHPSATPHVRPDVDGVPETALWTLYHRAREAARPSGWFEDPEAIRILQCIDYPFFRRFGRPHPAFAIRSAAFDRQVQAFLTEAPDGQVINLGDGLETQRFRIDNGTATWISVDLPESIALRERFIRPTSRHRHIAASALEERWVDAVDRQRPCFVTAQGLLMYLAPAEVRQVFQMLARRLPGSRLMFDTVPAWLKHFTALGLPAARGYVPPRMRWSMSENDLQAVQEWVPGLEMRIVEYAFPSPAGRWTLAAGGWAMSAARAIAPVRRALPVLCVVRWPAPQTP